jgi:hypothetical protein
MTENTSIFLFQAIAITESPYVNILFERCKISYYIFTSLITYRHYKADVPTVTHRSVPWSQQMAESTFEKKRALI